MALCPYLRHTERPPVSTDPYYLGRGLEDARTRQTPETVPLCSRGLMQYHPRIARRCDLVTFVAVAGRAAGVE